MDLRCEDGISSSLIKDRIMNNKSFKFKFEVENLLRAVRKHLQVLITCKTTKTWS